MGTIYECKRASCRKPSQGGYLIEAHAGAAARARVRPTAPGVSPVTRLNARAKADPSDPEAADRWARFVADWGAWNHVRGAAALIAAAMLTVALATR